MSFLHDIRSGGRMLVRRPALSATAVLALGLGIGLTATMFSIVYGAVLRGLPFDEADELMALFRNRPAQGVQFMGVGIHDFADWRAQQRSFEDIAAYYAETVNVSGTEGRPVRYLGAYVSAHLFDLLRVRPILGRTFRPEEDHPSSPPVLLLSYRAWRDRFRGDPDVIGRTIRANSQMTTIVGVMPERFGFPTQMDAWLPLRIDPLAYPRGGGPALEGTVIQAIGRLRDGATPEAAQAEMSAIAGRLAAEHPESNDGVGAVVVPLIDTFIGRQAVSMLYTMLGAVFGVLLIACANVANLLVARTLARSREIAIRTALGSSRLRTVGQLLAETFVLALAGAALGLVIARIGIDLFNVAMANTEPPYWIEITLNPAVVAFVLALTFVATLLSGLVPALRASNTALAEVLNDEARGASGLRLGRLSKALVVGEIAVSCGLLVAAGLMIRSVVNVAGYDYGFATGNIFTARLGLLEGDYPTPDSQRRFYAELIARLEGLPGIRRAALTSNLPVSGGPMLRLSVDGVAYASEQDHPVARRIVITPGYFEMFDAGPRRGRGFTPGDDEHALPAAVVSERFASLFFAGEDPIGKRVRLGADAEPWRTIVGVVPDMHVGGVAAGTFNPRHEAVYIPLAQNVINFMSIAVRTEQAPMTYARVIQDEVNRIDPNLPLYWVRSLEEQYALNTWFYRAFGALFVAFGVSALALATIGLYGVMSFSTTNRTREIGVRMALGARASNVLSLILRQGAVQLGAGLVVGIGLALLLSRGLGILLFGVRPWDPAIFAAVALTLGLAGLAACLVPARRATRVDPISALRYE